MTIEAMKRPMKPCETDCSKGIGLQKKKSSTDFVDTESSLSDCNENFQSINLLDRDAESPIKDKENSVTMDVTPIGFLASGIPCAQFENESTTFLTNNTVHSLEDSFFFSPSVSTPKLLLSGSPSFRSPSMFSDQHFNLALPSRPSSMSSVLTNHRSFANNWESPHSLSILEEETSDIIPDSQGDYDIQSIVSMNRRKKLKRPCNKKRHQIQRQVIRNDEHILSLPGGDKWDENGDISSSILEEETSDIIPDSQGDYDIQSIVSMNRRKKLKRPCNKKGHQIQRQVIGNDEHIVCLPGGDKCDGNSDISIDESFEDFYSIEHQNGNFSSAPPLLAGAGLAEPSNRNKKQAASTQFLMPNSSKTSPLRILKHSNSTNFDGGDNEIVMLSSSFPMPKAPTNNKSVEMNQVSDKLLYARNSETGNMQEENTKITPDISKEVSDSDNSSLSFDPGNTSPPSFYSEGPKNGCDQYEKEINLLVEDFYALLCYRASLLPADGSASLQCRLKMENLTDSKKSVCEKYDFSICLDNVENYEQDKSIIRQKESQRKENHDRSIAIRSDVPFLKKGTKEKYKIQNILTTSDDCDVEQLPAVHQSKSEKLRASSNQNKILKEPDKISNSGMRKLSQSLASKETDNFPIPRKFSKPRPRKLFLNSRKKHPKSNDSKMCVVENLSKYGFQQEPEMHQKLSNASLSTTEKTSSEFITKPNGTFCKFKNSEATTLPSKKTTSSINMKMKLPQKGSSVCNGKTPDLKGVKRALIVSTNHGKAEKYKQIKSDLDKFCSSPKYSQHLTIDHSPESEDYNGKTDSTANEIRHIYKKINDLSRNVTQLRRRTGLVDPRQVDPDSSLLSLSMQKCNADRDQPNMKRKFYIDKCNHPKQAHPIQTVFKVDVARSSNQLQTSHKLYHEDHMLKATPPFRR